MTTKVLVNTARERFYHNESKVFLKEKYTNKLTVPLSGGLWHITTELISYLRGSGNQTEILEDSYGHPVEVNRQELLELATKTYSEVMAEWHSEHQKLSKLR